MGIRKVPCPPAPREPVGSEAYVGLRKPAAALHDLTLGADFIRAMEIIAQRYCNIFEPKRWVVMPHKDGEGITAEQFLSVAQDLRRASKEAGES